MLKKKKNSKLAFSKKLLVFCLIFFLLTTCSVICIHYAFNDQLSVTEPVYITSHSNKIYVAHKDGDICEMSDDSICKNIFFVDGDNLNEFHVYDDVIISCTLNGHAYFYNKETKELLNRQYYSTSVRTCFADENAYYTASSRFLHIYDKFSFLKTRELEHEDYVRCAITSGNYILTCSGHYVYVWTNQNYPDKKIGPFDDIPTSIIESNDYFNILVGDEVHVYSKHHLEKLFTRKSQTRKIESALFSQVFYTLSSDGILSAYEERSSDKYQEVDLNILNLNPLEMTENDTHLFILRSSTEIIIVPKTFLNENYPRLKYGHTRIIRSIAISDNYLFSGDSIGNLFKWNLKTKKFEHLTETTHININKIELKDNQLFISQEGNYVDKKDLISQVTLEIDLGGSGNVLDFKVDPIENLIYGVNDDKTLRIYDYTLKNIIYTNTFLNNILSIDISDNYIALGLDNSQVVILDKETRSVKTHLNTQNNLANINELVFYKDKYLFTPSYDDYLTKWELDTFKDQILIKTGCSSVKKLYINEDYLYVGCSNGDLLIIDAITGTRVFVTNLHNDAITDIKRQGNILFTSSEDHTIRLWSIDKFFLTPPPEPTKTFKLNGQECLADSECRSNNCNNGICCSTGLICCVDDSQCENSAYVCSENYYCQIRQDPTLTPNPPTPSLIPTIEITSSPTFLPSPTEYFVATPKITKKPNVTYILPIIQPTIVKPSIAATPHVKEYNYFKNIWEMLGSLSTHNVLFIIGKTAHPMDSDVAISLASTFSRFAGETFIKVDNEIKMSDLKDKFVVVIGGPSVNHFASFITPDITSYCNYITYPCEIPYGLVEIYQPDDIFPKGALLVAGWEKEDTLHASKLLLYNSQYKKQLSKQAKIVTFFNKESGEQDILNEYKEEAG